MNPEKIKIILNWRPPQNVKSVKFFLGLVNYFQRFIRYYNYLQKPLVRLMRQGVPFIFGLKEIKAFKALKTAIIKEPVLKKWCPELPTKVKTNTFNGITNGVLS